MTENNIEVKLEEGAKALATQSSNISITNKEQSETATEFMTLCAQMVKRIKTYWDGTKDEPGPLTLAKKTYDSLRMKKNAMLVNPTTAREVVEGKLREYRAEQRRIAEQQAKLAEEARLKEEQRLKDKELKKAERALNKGNEEKAEEHLEKAEEVYVPPVEVAPTINKTEQTETGSSTGIMDIKIEVQDIKKIAEGVVFGVIPAHLIDIKPSAVKTWAKGNGYKNGVFHGIKVSEFERFSVRGA